MRFRFCGDLDCPDWILAEMSTLSKLSSIKVKMLCTQVIKSLLNEPMDNEKLMKIAADAKFETDDLKSCMAVLTLILGNATKYAVDASSLSNELQQLGMPKEHTTVLCKCYEENATSLYGEFFRKSLRLSKLISVDWSVDYVLSSSSLNEVNQPFVRVKIVTKDPKTEKLDSVSMSLTPDKFVLLLAELKEAQKIIEGL